MAPTIVSRDTRSVNRLLPRWGWRHPCTLACLRALSLDVSTTPAGPYYGIVTGEHSTAVSKRPPLGIAHFRSASLKPVLLVTLILSGGSACVRVAPPVPKLPALPESAVASVPGTWDPWYAKVSPDGRSIAVLALDTGFHFRLATIRSGRSLFITPPSVTVADFAWIDSQTLVVAAGLESVDLRMFTLSGRQVRVVRPSTLFNAGQIGMTVTPDGRAAIVSAWAPGMATTPAQLLSVDLADGATANLTLAAPHVDHEWPTFLDAHHLAFTGAPVAPDSGDAGAAWIGVLDTRSNAVTVVQKTANLDGIDGVTASYGRNRIIYETGVPYLGNQRLWSVKPSPSTPPIAIANGDGLRWPSFAPDGSLLIITRVDPTPSGGGTLEWLRLPLAL
jgi:hypothetical protein